MVGVGDMLYDDDEFDEEEFDEDVPDDIDGEHPVLTSLLFSRQF
jgi:hypothetical protein